MRIRVSYCQPLTIDEIRVGNIQLQYCYYFCRSLFFSSPSVQQILFQILPLNVVKNVLGTSLRHALQYNNNWSRSDVCVYASCGSMHGKIYLSVFL